MRSGRREPTPEYIPTLAPRGLTGLRLLVRKVSPFSATCTGKLSHEADENVDTDRQRRAGALAAGLDQKAYDQLIIVASPVTLGDLRSTISEGVRAKVVGEIAQDLTKTPNGDVAGHLKHVLIV